MQSKHGQAQRERVRAECFEGGLNHLCGPVLPGFPWPHHLALSALESTFGLTKDPPLCAYASFSQDGFQCKGFWEVDRTYYGPGPSLPWLLRNLSARMSFRRSP